MNACLRAAVIQALTESAQPIGFRRGGLGLVRGHRQDTVTLNRGHVRHILERGSTFLGSSRTEEFSRYLDVTEVDVIAAAGRQIAATAETFALDALILIGGDLTCLGARAIWRASNESLPIVVVPASIDNDIKQTELTIGFDTAVQETTSYIDKIRETARAFDRIFIVEVMGRRHGLLAAEAALATGVEELLVPEERYAEADLDALARRVLKQNRSVIIVVSEGADLPLRESAPAPSTASAIRASLEWEEARRHRDQGDSADHDGTRVSPGRALERYLQARAGRSREVRYGGPGHTLRGASPTGLSRLLALRTGTCAVGEAADMVRGQSGFRLVGIDRRLLPKTVDLAEHTSFTRESSKRVLAMKELVIRHAY